MKKFLAISTFLAFAFTGTAANAIGCASGAVAGGVAGHYAGHHAVVGAVGGCIAGHHIRKQQKAAERAKREQEMQGRQPN